MDYNKVAEKTLHTLREWQKAHPKPDFPGQEHDLADYVTQGIISAIKEMKSQE